MPRAAGDENLLDVRLRGARHAADGAPSMGVSRQPSTVRPSSHDALENAFALQALVALHGQERHAHAVFAGGGSVKPSLAHSRAKNLCGI
jgi:hypothetical protein